jgi:ceramide glucosyltransferase
MGLLYILLLVLVVGSAVYCILVIEAARRYRHRMFPAFAAAPVVPISVLKPLRGIEEGLAENLRSFLAQDYPSFEVLFGVDEPDDPALEVAMAVSREFPHVACRCLVTGTPSYRNPKVYSLERLVAAARYDLLVMSDSDIRVGPDLLRVIAAEFADQNLGLVTCPYRAVSGNSFWSRLEAIGINTEFIAGVLVARLIEGMKFAVGPTIVIRKKVLESIGGLQRVKDYYIDDFLLGKFAAGHGFGVELSAYVIEHHIGAQGFLDNLRHRVMWLRGTRRSRPKGYFGQIFTYTLPLALLLLILKPALWLLCISAILLRFVSAWAVAVYVLRDPLTSRSWHLLPLEDLLSWFFWLAALFGNTILWRGRRFALLPDGRFQPLERESAG